MSTSLLDKFKNRSSFYQILYIFITINIIVILILLLLFLKNYEFLTYKGIIRNNHDLVISNLTRGETEILTNSKLKIENKNIKYEVLDIFKENSLYVLKLKLDKYYLDSRSVKVKFIVKEENLLEYIIEKMKGDL